MKSPQLINYPSLPPKEFVRPVFKLAATRDCLGASLSAYITYHNPWYKTHHVETPSHAITYVYKVLVPVPVSKAEYDHRVASMKERQFENVLPIQIEKIERLIRCEVSTSVPRLLTCGRGRSAQNWTLNSRPTGSGILFQRTALIRWVARTTTRSVSSTTSPGRSLRSTTTQI